MSLMSVHANATLNSQQATLLKLADEYCERGNPYVVSAAVWVRPVIADYIAMVKERYLAIHRNAKDGHIIASEIVTASDQFLDEIIEIIVSAFPLTASYHVRGITSKIRNDLAIARLDTHAGLDKIQAAVTQSSYANVMDKLNNKKLTSKKFKAYCQNHPETRDAMCGIVFITPLFHAVAKQCIANRDYTEAGNAPAKKASKEATFTTFRRYWQSLPHGDACFALAVRKLIHDDSLLKRVIRHRADVQELLLSYCPTLEMRKQVLQHILQNDALSLRTVVSIFELLPEGANINWRVDFAKFGIKKYQVITQNKNPEEWRHSRKKLRSDAYQELCEYYRFGTSLEKKVIIYALLDSHGNRMQRLVCIAMGFARPEIAKKIIYASMKQDAEILKINLQELDEQVIQKIVAKTNAGKTMANGAYTPIIEKLKQFVPSPVAMKSMF